ncbi:branched-chain amino acid ABC transporter permease [Pseudoroseomonas ludipueritiae]|uniref:Branched-chain amino acid ABC transporter permease n=1 Tax=Pseudoroseomonas ludipueritiae TaxID=198093 RepID=A0ABR7R9G3_9PROT|nr:branched-chain amino acid ABC transporter permease [Pseudoroseomonas ludipueritiae]MBC9178311.1 branched-chain amino acid ABC transporter permease [Pseudoroseomonas ludipueritiae]MCG7362382.1 branched-chain amino acid ABC transporter permease [Roseomonas sp. ACRSG]
MILLQQIINGLMLGGLYALVAVSFTFVIGMLNFLNFSIPGIFMLGGMLSWALMVQYALPWYAAVPLALLAGILASLLVERFTYRYMRTRFGDATEHAIPLVSSIGFLILFQGLVQIQWGAELHSFPSPWQDTSIRLGGLLISIPQVVSLLLALALVFGLTLVLGRTSLGRSLRAVAESPDTAQLLGIDLPRLIPAVFVVAGLLSALAGVLFALNYLQVSHVMGDEIASFAMAAMVVGGLGNVWGAIAGGLLLGLLEVLTIFFLGAKVIKPVVWGALFLLILLRPQGLFGKPYVGRGKF